jgi:hypothetical protein
MSQTRQTAGCETWRACAPRRRAFRSSRDRARARA